MKRTRYNITYIIRLPLHVKKILQTNWDLKIHYLQYFYLTCSLTFSIHVKCHVFYLKHLQMHCIVFKTFLSKAKPCAWKDLLNILSIINTSSYFIHYHLGYKCRESSTYVTRQLKHIGSSSSRAFSASTLILPLAPFRNHGCSWHL